MPNRFQLCDTDARTGITRVMRHVSLEEGMRLVEREKADPVVHHDSGKVIGFELRVITPQVGKVQRVVVSEISEPAARPSCTAFSRAEVEAIVGMRGKSQTAGLSEDQKAERIRRRWCAEDLVESAQQKLAVYTKVH